MIKSLPQNVYMPVLRFFVLLLGAALLAFASATFLYLAAYPKLVWTTVFYWTDVVFAMLLTLYYGILALKWAFDL